GVVQDRVDHDLAGGDPHAWSVRRLRDGPVGSDGHGDGAVALHGDGAVVYRAGVLGELGDAQLVVLDAITRGGVGQFVAVGDERRQRFFGQVEGRGDERRAGLKQDLGGQAGGRWQGPAVG